MRTTNSISAPPETIEKWRIMASEKINRVTGKAMKKNQFLNWLILWAWNHWDDLKGSE